MHILELESFNLDQVPHWPALEGRLGQWAGSINAPMRLLAYSRPFVMVPALQRVQQRRQPLDTLSRLAPPLLAAIDGLLHDTPGAAHPAEVVDGLPPAERDTFARWAQTTLPGSGIVQLPWAVSDATWQACGDALRTTFWPLPWLADQARFLDDLGRQHLRSAHYYLLIWTDQPAAPLVATLRQVLQRRVTLRETLPPILPGVYRRDELAMRLSPEQPGQPYLTCLHTAGCTGEWSAALAHSLLADEGGDVTLAIDLLPISREKTIQEAASSNKSARVRQKYNTDPDPHAERVEADTATVLRAVGIAQQQLHRCHVTALLSAETPAALEARVATFRSRCGTALAFDRAAGVQGELLKTFSTIPASQINAPLTRWAWPTLTQGVGCLLGTVGYKRASSTDGILLGLDARRRAPLFFDFFGDSAVGNELAHMLFFGIPGKGKTFLMNLLSIRAALAGWRVIWIDAFHNAKRLKRALGAGCTVTAFDFDAGVNVLEVVMDRQQASWLPAQVEYALGQLALLLGEVGRNHKGQQCLIPKRFSIGERGATDRALTRLYGRLPSGPLRPDQMPRLADLIAELDGLATPNATVIANALQELLYGTTDRGATELTSAGQRFNVPGQVDWQFGNAVNCYDFSAIAKDATHLLPFYYTQAFGAVNRFVRSTSRDVTQPTLLAVDEVGWAFQNEAVEVMAFENSKTARKYRLGQLLADQHPSTLLATPAGQNIFGQARATFVFGLDGQAAQQLRGAKPHLTQNHQEFITTAQTGYCLADIDGDVYEMLCEPTPREWLGLKGS
jgi:hypothetical protein